MADIAGMSPLDDADPTELGPYRLLGRLGDGGMGSVYLGRREGGGENGPLVAVKVIRPDLARQPQFRERFLREAQAAHRVARFCTAEVLDVSTHGSRPYLVTEYIDGPTLGTAVRATGGLATAQLERLAVAIASALTAIHAADVIHRDLKPSNIMLSKSGPRVIDFGIARALDAVGNLTQGLVGTPGYMAPEQAAGEPTTQAVDIYAWGAVMLFAATGQAPFGSGPTAVILHRVMTDAPDLSSVPEPLRSLVARAMAKDPADRPSADELLLLTHRLHATPRPNGQRQAAEPHTPPPTPPDLGDTQPLPLLVTAPPLPAQPTPAQPAPARRQPPATGRRRRWLAAGTATAVVLAATVVILTTTHHRGHSAIATTRATATTTGATGTGAHATTASLLTRTPPRKAATIVGSHPSVTFAPAGRTLAVVDDDGALRLWNLDDPGRPTPDGSAFTTGVASTVFTPGGRTLAVDYQDNTTQLWDVTAPASPRALSTRFGDTTANTQWSSGSSFSADGHTLVRGAAKQGAQLWDVTDPTHPAATGEPIDLPAWNASFSPKGHLLVTGTSGEGTESIRLWDTTEPAKPVALGGPVADSGSELLVFSPDGRTLAACCLALRLWNVVDAAHPAPIGQPLFIVPSNGGFDYAYSPDGTVLATADGLDSTVSLWNVTDTSAPRKIGAALDSVSGDALVAFSADRTLLATFTTTGAIQLWTLR